MRTSPYALLWGLCLVAFCAKGSVLHSQTVAQALADYDAIVRNYNIITTGALTLNGTHTDGAIAAGGTLTISGGSIIAMHSDATAGSNPAIYANGQVQLSGGNQIDSGYVATPNLSVDATWTNNNGQRTLSSGSGTLSYNTTNALAYADPRTVAVADPIDWVNLQTDLVAVSNALAAATATGTATLSGQNLTFSSNVSGVTVFTLDASKIVNGVYDINGDGTYDQSNESISNITANLNADQFFVINVTNATSASGTVLFDGVSNFNSGSNNTQLLWNILPDANSSTSDTLILGTNFYGSILAPLVDIQSNGKYINGQVAAASYSQTNAEVHYAGGYNAPEVAFTPVPEPSTYAFGALAVGVGAAVWRRRRGSSPASTRAQS